MVFGVRASEFKKEVTDQASWKSRIVGNKRETRNEKLYLTWIVLSNESSVWRTRSFSCLMVTSVIDRKKERKMNGGIFNHNILMYIFFLWLFSKGGPGGWVSKAGNCRSILIVYFSKLNKKSVKEKNWWAKKNTKPNCRWGMKINDNSHSLLPQQQAYVRQKWIAKKLHMQWTQLLMQTKKNAQNNRLFLHSFFVLFNFCFFFV